jgi:hypothetical protein
MGNGRRSNPSFPSLLLDRKEVDPQRMTAWSSRESSGYSRQEPGGKIFPRGIRTPRHAGVVSRNGTRPTF